MRRTLHYLLLSILLLPNSLYAQDNGEPLELSLEEAMNLAVKNNVQAKNARLDRLNQKAINAEVTGRALPQISANGEYKDYINPIQSFVPAEFVGGPPNTFIAVPFTPKYGATATASGNQVLFDGSLFVALQAKNTLLQLYDEQVQFTEEEIRYNIQKAYYAIIVAEKQYETMKETIKYMRNIGNETEAYYENGLIEKLDIDRITVQINNLASDSIKVGNTIRVSKDMLKHQMGIPLDISIILIDTSVDHNMEAANLLLTDNFNYSDRTDYLLLQTQLKVNQYDLKRHKLSGLPSLAAFGSASYTYQTNNFDDLFTERYIFFSLVGLRLNVPIFDGMQRRNRVKQAEFSIQKTRNNIDNLERGIDQQVKQYKTTLKNAIYTLNNQKRNFELAQEVLDKSRKKYNAGVGSSLEVSQSQTDLLSAQNNYYQAMLEVINAQSDLQKATGDFKTNN